MKSYNLHKEIFMGHDAWTWEVDGTTYHAPSYGGLWKDVSNGIWVYPNGTKEMETIPKQIRGTCDYTACETYSGMLRKIKREYAEDEEYNRFISQH